MQKIYRTFFICAFLFYFAPKWVLATQCESFTSFLFTKGFDTPTSEAILQESSQEVQIKQTTTHLVAFISSVNTSEMSTSQAKQVVEKINLLRARQGLLLFMHGMMKESAYLQNDVTQIVFKEFTQKSDLPISSLEHITGECGKRIISIVAIPIDKIPSTNMKLLSSEQFKTHYCRELYTRVELLIGDARYQEALVYLKELHDLKWTNVDAYLDTVFCFIEVGQINDAQEIAMEVLYDLENELTSSTAKALGDLFTLLMMPKQTQEAYALEARLIL